MNELMGKMKAKNFQDDDIPTAYDEAVKFFMSKNIITKNDFVKLDKKARKFAFTVAKVDSQRLLDDIKKSIDQALATGIPTAEWLSNIDTVFMNSGMHALNDYHLKTVFRNNMQTALNEGSMAMLKQADPSEFPLWQYVTTLDGRERKSHRDNNKYTAPANDPVWKILQPPLDHNCRCRIRPVHSSEGLKSWNKKPVMKPDEMKFVTPGKIKKARAAAAKKAKTAAKKPVAASSPEKVRKDIIKTHQSRMKSIIKQENLSDQYKTAWMATNEKLDELNTKWLNVQGEGFRVAQSWDPNENWPADLKKRYFDLKNKMNALADQQEKAYDKWHKQLSKVNDARRNLTSDLSKKLYVPESGDFGFKIGHKIRTRDTQMQVQIRSGIQYFTRFISKDILDPTDLTDANKLQFKKVSSSRAYFHDKDPDGRGPSVNLGSYSGTRSVVHELGHWLEDLHPKVQEQIQRFYQKRTFNEKLSWLGDSYRQNEYTKRDKFLNPYMGKDYGGRASEILSMGLEYFYKDPYALAAGDPEYFDFIYNLVRGKY
jgi:SPP1 gp7 family putative phage head morphogenesis protein